MLLEAPDWAATWPEESKKAPLSISEAELPKITLLNFILLIFIIPPKAKVPLNLGLIIISQDLLRQRKIADQPLSVGEIQLQKSPVPRVPGATNNLI